MSGEIRETAPFLTIEHTDNKFIVRSPKLVIGDEVFEERCRIFEDADVFCAWFKRCAEAIQNQADTLELNLLANELTVNR